MENMRLFLRISRDFDRGLSQQIDGGDRDIDGSRHGKLTAADGEVD